MDLNFKDEESAKFFKEISITKISNNLKKDEKAIYEDIFLGKKEIKKLDKNICKENPKNQTSIDIDINLEKKIDSQNQKLIRMEAKQNVILEILEHFPLPSVKSLKVKEISKSNIEILELNLELFISKLVILSTQSTDKHITNLLNLLKKTSEYLISNSFYIFTKDTTLINEIITELNYLGVSNSKYNKLINETEIIVKDIDSNSKKRIFEKSYFFANLLLEKGLLLNAITLLNEVISIYIVESVKKFSTKIQKYTYLVGEKDIPLLYSHVKEFFIKNYEKDSVESKIPFFPSHIVIKDIDNEIIKKLKKINTTWSNRGDAGLFKKYSYIIKRVRSIRNNVAHGNLEVDYRELKNELKILNDDFYYLSIKKNIFKLK